MSWYVVAGGDNQETPKGQEEAREAEEGWEKRMFLTGSCYPVEKQWGSEECGKPW